MVEEPAKKQKVIDKLHWYHSIVGLVKSSDLINCSQGFCVNCFVIDLLTDLLYL